MLYGWQFRKMNDVEKMFWRDTEVYVLQKIILDHIKKIPPPIREGSSFPHAISLNPLSMRNIHRQKYVKKQYEDRYSPLKLQMCIKTIKKCTFHMLCNCSQMNYVEKATLGA